MSSIAMHLRNQGFLPAQLLTECGGAKNLLPSFMALVAIVDVPCLYVNPTSHGNTRFVHIFLGQHALF